MSVRSSSILLLVLLLIIINLHELHAQQFQTSCPYIRTSVIVSDCVFDTGLYLSLGARIFNTRSIDFVGHYSLDSIPVLPVQNKLNTEPINTLVYNLSGTFVSIVPLILNCPRLPENIIFTECQYTTIKLKSSKMRQQSEYVRAQLSILNVTDLGIRSVLFLQPGEIALQSCKAYDCDNQRAYLTASNETFDMSIRYEKPVDSVCQLTEDCSSVIDLVHCSTLTHTCQCNNQNTSIVDFNHLGRYCVDSITQSNCTKFSRRCLKYCDSSQTPHCLCPPILTRKVRKTNGLYDCELERDSSCTVNDQIAKCPTGTYCDGVRCRTTVSFGSISQDNVTFYRRTSPPTLHEQNLLSSTADSQLTLRDNDSVNKQHQTATFIRTLLIIITAIVLFFILIILIIVILVKSHRFRIASASTYSENKSTIPTPTQSSSQYKNQRSLYKIPNTPPPSSSNNYPDSLSTVSTIVNGQSTPFCRYNLPTSFDNYMSTNTGGLLPQSQLSPRFHRQTTTTSQLRSLNVPPPIRTPSSTRIMMFPDHTNILSKHLPPTRIVTNNYHQTTTMRKNNSTMPIVTRLQNGDVLISA